MKQIKLKSIILLILALLLPATATAYYVQVDGIYYDIDYTDEVKVVEGESPYTGSIVIPETMTWNGKTYRVTSIDSYAFSHCSITSITLPNSIVFIGEGAFYTCI